MVKLFKDKRFWGLVCIIIVVFVIFMFLKFVGFDFKMEGFQEDGADTDASDNTFEYATNYNSSKSNKDSIATRRGHGVAKGRQGGSF